MFLNVDSSCCKKPSGSDCERLAKVPAWLGALSAVVVGDGGVASHMEMEMEVTAACRLVFRRYPCCQSLSA